MEHIEWEDVQKLLHNDMETADRLRQDIKKWLLSGRKYKVHESDADDLVQEVFLKFLQALREEKEVRNPASYLKSITRHKAKDYWQNTIRKKLETSTDRALIRYNDPSEVLYNLHVAHKTYLKPETSHNFADLIRSVQGFVVEEGITLTPRFLADVLAPYIDAIAAIQNIYDDVRQVPKHEVVIRFIGHFSPIDVSLNGAADAISAVKEDLIPWRKEHAKQIAVLQEKQVQAEIKKKNAEVLEIRSRSSKERAEAKKIEAEAEKLKAEAEKMYLENEKLKFELESAKLKLALELVAKMKPDLPEPDRIAYAVRLLPAINVIITSDIELSKLLP
jgi:DNA-directed RNA polymerase specialized sigma24 family protein